MANVKPRAQLTQTAKVGCGCLSIFGALLFLMLLVGHSHNSESGTEKHVETNNLELRTEKHLETHNSESASDRHVEAFTMCETYVKRRLKAPSSAKFGWITDSTIVGSGDGPYTIDGYVDAQNSFGAMLRNQYTCQVQSIGGGRWNLL